MGAISEPILESFLDGLRQQIEFSHALRQRTDRFLAEGFSSFSYIDVVEPKLTSITADLLRPDGVHGQGDLFVRAFLRSIGIPDREAPLHIVAEAPTRFIEHSLRRIDLKLCWSDFVLGIENKPWALDQDSQIEDYVKDLDKESKGRFLLVYLSESGSDPTLAEHPLRRLEELKMREAKGELGGIRVLSYSKVMCQWLGDCIHECQSERVRWFLRDFREYLLHNLPQSDVEGQNMHVSDDVVVAYALLNKTNLDVACTVASRFNEIRRSVIGRFGEELEKELRQRSPGLVIVRNKIKSEPLTRYNGLHVGKQSWSGRFSIAIENSCGSDGVYFGVVKEKEVRGRILPDLAAKLDSVFGRGESATKSWDWWQRLKEPYRDWNDERVLVSMYEGKTR